MSDQDRNILKNEEQDPDVEGHKVRLRNEEGTEDVVRTDSDEDPDVEGHKLMPRNVPRNNL